MATKQCPYCEASNPEDEKYCQTCGIPQTGIPEDAGRADSFQPAPDKRTVSARLADPTTRNITVAVGALVLFGIGFLFGRATGGSSSPGEDVAAPEPPVVTTTVAASTTTQAPTTTTSTTTTAAPIEYTDVPDDQEHAEAIEALADLGVQSSCNPPANTLFCPNDAMTREQMASLLASALRYEDAGNTDLFEDDNDSVYEADIQKIAVAKITSGCNPPDNTLFCPNDPVTRGQISAFLVRAFDLTAPEGSDVFTDDDGSVFEPSLNAVGSAGILEACNPPDNTEACPDDLVTRGQMAAILVRALS